MLESRGQNQSEMEQTTLHYLVKGTFSYEAFSVVQGFITYFDFTVDILSMSVEIILLLSLSKLKM